MTSYDYNTLDEASTTIDIWLKTFDQKVLYFNSFEKLQEIDSEHLDPIRDIELLNNVHILGIAIMRYNNTIQNLWEHYENYRDLFKEEPNEKRLDDLMSIKPAVSDLKKQLPEFLKMCEESIIWLRCAGNNSDNSLFYKLTSLVKTKITEEDLDIERKKLEEEKQTKTHHVRT